MELNSVRTPPTNRGVHSTEIDNIFLDIKGQTNDLEQFIAFISYFFIF